MPRWTNMLLTRHHGWLRRSDALLLFYFSLVNNTVTHSYEEFPWKNPVILGSCVMKNRDGYFFSQRDEKVWILIFSWEAKLFLGGGGRTVSPPLPLKIVPRGLLFLPKKKKNRISLFLRSPTVQNFNPSCLKMALSIAMFLLRSHVLTFPTDIQRDPRKTYLSPSPLKNACHVM